jgi:hypothetical protein
MLDAGKWRLKLASRTMPYGGCENHVIRKPTFVYLAAVSVRVGDYPSERTVAFTNHQFQNDNYPWTNVGWDQATSEDSFEQARGTMHWSLQ